MGTIKKLKVVLTKVGTAYEPTKEYHLHDYIVIDDATIYTCKRVDKETMTCIGHDLTDTNFWDKSIDLSDVLAKATKATEGATTAAQEANAATAKATKAATDATTAAQGANTAAQEANTATEKATKATTDANVATTAANAAAEKVNEAVTEWINKGYLFRGIATPTTDPGTPDGPVFYLASEAGTYTNFEGVELTDQVLILSNKNGSWVKTDTGIATSTKVTELDVRSSNVFVFSKKGKNLLNPDTFVVGEWVMSDGYIGKIGFGIGRTEFIPIKEGESLTCSSTLGFSQCRAALYDKNFIPIPGTITTDESASSRTVTWVENAAYAVFTFRKYPTDEKEDMVEMGTDVTSYEKYYWNKDVQEQLYNNSRVINFNFDRVRYGRDIFSQDGFLNNQGVITQAQGFIHTDYIEIQPDRVITIFSIAVWGNEYGCGICFYDQDKKFIKSVYNTITLDYPSVGFYSLSEIPQNAKYIRVGGYGEYKTQYIEICNLTEAFLNKIKEISGAKKTMFIKKTDSDIEILKKMIECFNKGNYDVYFETGEYTFQEAYIYMRDTLRWDWTMEFPIGNNCRYYLNNSVIKSIPPAETYEKPRNVFGTKASASNFELYDGTIINQGGIYCVHDEANTDNSSYIHKYKNINMSYLKGDKTEGLSKCIGGGSGVDGIVIIEDCVFKTENTTSAVSWHGSNNSNSGRMSFTVVGNYFNKGMSLDGTLKEGDYYKLMFANNSVGQESDIPNSSEWHEKYIFNNEVRTSL